MKTSGETDFLTNGNFVKTFENVPSVLTIVIQIKKWTSVMLHHVRSRGGNAICIGRFRGVIPALLSILAFFKVFFGALWSIFSHFEAFLAVLDKSRFIRTKKNFWPGRPSKRQSLFIRTKKFRICVLISRLECSKFYS